MNTEISTAATTETKRYQCRHILTDGHRCGSPSLRHEPFCYYHHTTRRPIAAPQARRARTTNFDLPLPEDRASIQLSIGEVLRRIAANQIDPKRAGLLLYGLQIASLNLPRQLQIKPTHQTEADLVEDIVMDETLGPLAPQTEVIRHKSVVEALLDRLREHDEEEQAEQEEEQQPVTIYDPIYDPIQNRLVPIQPLAPATAEPTTLPQIQACQAPSAECGRMIAEAAGDPGFAAACGVLPQTPAPRMASLEESSSAARREDRLVQAHAREPRRRCTTMIGDGIQVSRR